MLDVRGLRGASHGALTLNCRVMSSGDDGATVDGTAVGDGATVVQHNSGADDDSATIAAAAARRDPAIDTDAGPTVQLPHSPIDPPPIPPTPPPRASRPNLGGAQRTSTMSLTTAADALRNEEIERTRLFIRMGWALSVAAIAIVPLMGGPIAINTLFVLGLVVGMIVSYGYHRAFADPKKYTERSLLTLSIMCVINGHLAVLYYGVFTATPAIVVIGIHFVARTELERLARQIFAWAIACYVAITLPIVVGWLDDPGVFRSDADLELATRAVGALFVLGVYTLAYVTARAFRAASLRSIEQLQRATRLASQRQALMEELRVDLERALRIGAPGRHTDQVVGQLELGVLLGRGAMGEVYDAVHLGTGEPAAVKLLRRELLTDPTQVARFLREVKASGAVESPHIVKVIETSSEDAPLPYLAMERLRGTTLAELLRNNLKLAPRTVHDLLRQVGAGIDAAASAGIVHRDLKPQNLFLAGDVWKILDFGVATLAEENSGTLTQGGIVGTPSYMAPEQAQGKRVDARSDLYALAVVAYRSLTGRHPFTAPDTPSLLYSIVHEMPLRPGELVDVPADVDRWFALALAKSPDDRFATGALLATTFDGAINGALDAGTRRRADALLRKQPWGTE